MKQATENCEERPADRNEYKRPKLIDFGPIGALTQAGSGSSGEMASGGMMSGDTCGDSAFQVNANMC
jgi:hypothetical protein